MTISLAGYTLVNPAEETIDYEVLGASFLSANGSINHDNLSGNSVQTISLSWKAVSEAVRDDILAAFRAIYTADRSYTDIRGDTITVTATPGRDRLSSVAVNRSTPLYNITLKMREVV